MTYYKLYHKENDTGDESFNQYFNLVGDNDHPLRIARQRLLRFYDTLPEFKKVGEGRWRLNGIHRHPMTGLGVWHLEYSHDE